MNVQGDCRQEADNGVGVGILFLLLGVYLILARWLNTKFAFLGRDDLERERAAGIWRFGRGPRLLLWISIAIPLPVCLTGVLVAGTQGWVASFIFSVGWTVFIYRTGLHIRVELRTASVVVVNAIRRREIAWSDISSIGFPGYNGLRIGLNNGKSVRASVGQKSNIAAWRGKRTNADELTDALRAHLSGERTISAEQAADSAAWAALAKKRARGVIVFGLIWIGAWAVIRAKLGL